MIFGCIAQYKAYRKRGFLIQKKPTNLPKSQFVSINSLFDLKNNPYGLVFFKGKWCSATDIRPRMVIITIIRKKKGVFAGSNAFLAIVMPMLISVFVVLSSF